ncbi:MAG: hypothetical protein FJ098_03615 [Deltaproteobacteria bacterium]|nr:hypothetical protein [Deltaproteobacteria bacterium]
MWCLLLPLVLAGTPWDPPGEVVILRPDLAAPAPPELWRDLYRIVRYRPEGTPCLATRGEPATEVRRIRFKEPFQVAETVDGWLRSGTGDAACWVDREETSRFHERTVLCPAGGPPRQVLVPLAGLLEAGDPATAPRRDAGPRWPTFYMIAREELYPLLPGEETVPLHDRHGTVLAQVAPWFRKAAMYQGTARLADGRLINVDRITKRWGRTFRVYPDGVMGEGIQGFRVYPYRSAALDFDHLCDALGGTGCSPSPAARERPEDRTRRTATNRKALAGTLLYLPRLEGIPLPDGTSHDGFVCAVDVGGGIRGPRIDLFVGWEGGGNPYYPACRESNAFLRGGVETLVPWDWHAWTWSDAEKAWIRAEEDEYRDTAPRKGLQVFVVEGVRCRRVAR